MAVYKRGKVYWYEFTFKGERIRDSTHQGNQNVARAIAAAHRTRLAMGEVGIIEKKLAPTLKEFAPKFERAVETLCADHPDTISFYKEKMRRLLECTSLAGCRLDDIDEARIDAYKQSRTRQTSRYNRPLSPASVNRELATLRRLLRLAHEWKIIDRVPRIRLLRGERNREFVLAHKEESQYLKAAPQPLRDIALLILDTGLRPGEAVKVQWPNVHLEPLANAKSGYIHVPDGKSKNAKRNLSLTLRVSKMLKARQAAAKSLWAFPSENGEHFLVTSIDHQHEELRNKLKLPQEFVPHSLRHTFGTRLGESETEAFTIMKIMGHSSVTVSQRYVHPTPESMERAFERLETLNKRKRHAGKPRQGARDQRVPTISTTVKKKRGNVSL